MNWLQSQAFSWGLNHLVLPALAPIVFLLIQWAKQGQSIIDNLPKPAKIALAPLLSSLIVTLAAFSNHDLTCAATASCTLVDLTVPLVTAVLGSAGAWLLHYLKNRAVPPTPSTPTQ